jgi:hypothetical protein
MQPEDLIWRGFLPKELPPIFSSYPYAVHVQSKGAPRLHDSPRPGDGLNSRLATHNLARPGNLRRKLHIPNPFNFFAIADLLCGSWAEVEAQLGKASLSVSRPIEDPHERRALVPATSGTDLSVTRAANRARGRYVVQTDIARFYASIYTHSIPWAVHGKGWAKNHRHGGFANELDRALRLSQDGQTVGIPVGPDTSLVVAELIGAAIDAELQGRGLTGFRFMDDYEFVFWTRSEAEHAVNAIEETLATFELAINPRKTRIAKLPLELEYPWRRPLAVFDFQPGSLAERKSFTNYFARMFEEWRKHPREPVISYGVSRLRDVTFSEDDWSFVQHLLCQCILCEPSSLRSMYQILHAHREYTLDNAVEVALNRIVADHGPLGHGSEVAWAIWSGTDLGLSIKAGAAAVLARSEDPIVRLVALHAREAGRIEGDEAFRRWDASLSQGSLYDEQWIFAYEAGVRGWLENEALVVGDDPNFAQLAEGDVRFLVLGEEYDVRDVWGAYGFF